MYALPAATTSYRPRYGRMDRHHGFLDLQVNGYDGVDFNADRLSLPALEQACQRLQQDGVAGILATVITDDIDSMCRRLANLCQAREASPTIAQIICGLHIEGPFLNAEPGYIGAHPRHAAQVADLDGMQRLLDAAAGLTRIVTLAPERDPDYRVTQYLVQQGVTVSAGHCNPSLEQLRGAIDAGLSMFTHLGNGCPLEMHRHDNIIQRVLSLADQLWVGFIADGVHVPYHALANYLAVVGLQRAIVVTDAIEAAGRGPGTYQIGGQSVVVDETLATWSADRSHLFGSAMTMPAAVARLSRDLGLSDAQIDQLTQHNPRAAIGL